MSKGLDWEWRDTVATHCIDFQRDLRSLRHSVVLVSPVKNPLSTVTMLCGKIDGL